MSDTGHTTANVYANTGPESAEFPWAVSLDHHEPVAVFTEHSYALPFAATLLDILNLHTLAIVDSESQGSASEPDIGQIEDEWNHQ